METFRLFVALVPPPVVRAELAAATGKLDGARRVPAENIHLTLRFIGDCDPDRRDALATALEAVRVEPFVLPVGGLGVFPSRGPARVLWAGVGHAHTRLFQLRKQVDEALLGVDLTLDVHHFQPHFTLARLEPGYDGRALARFLERNAAFEAPPFRVDAFHLLASELRGDGPPEYRPVRSFPLSA
jgi:2'-5' RNA ligase